MQMAGRAWISAGAALAGLAVACGAFGAHGLKALLDAEAFGWWQTAVQYQMWQALGVLALGFSGLHWIRLPAGLLTLGTIIFSGTLYAMALGAPRWLGGVTPLGGVLMIAGWALTALRAFQSRRES